MMRFVRGSQRVRPLAAALMALVLSVGVPVTLASVQSRTGATSAAADLPDTLLVAQWPSSTTTALGYLIQREMAVLEPSTGALRPILQGAQQPVVSPDGRELYFVQYLLDGDTLRTNVVTLTSDTLAPVWITTVAAMPRPPAQQPNLVARAMAATAERVYVATSGGQPNDPLEIVALDRADGRELSRWRVDVGSTIGGVSLAVSADGSSLITLVTAAGAYGPSSGPPLTLLRVSLADGQEQVRLGPVRDAGIFVWDSRPTPDGRALYKVNTGEGQPGAGVVFLDLATASPEILDVGFTLPRGIDFPPHEWGISADGQQLFFVAPLTNEFAVVDLAARRVVQKGLLSRPAEPAAAQASPLEGLRGALQALFVSDALAKVPFGERLQVSADGRFLFGIGVRQDRNSARADGIWVIDTSQWQITQHWLSGAEPWAALLGAHDQHLWVQDQPGRIGSPSGGLHLLDTSTGVDMHLNTTLDAGQIFTVADLYVDQYGHSAQSPTAEAARAQIVPIAAMVVRTIPTTLVSGDAVALEARFVEPLSGNALEPGQTGVQFEPPARVFAQVAEGNGTPTTVQLDLAEFGVYRGSFTAPMPNSWSLGAFNVQMTAEWPDGSRRNSPAQEAFTVQPALPGTDGRRYILRVTSQPDPAVADQPATVRIAIVDAETGAPVQDETRLVGGAPAIVEASFYGGGGFTKPPFTPLGGGIYEGQVRLFSPGSWRVIATLGAPINGTYTIGTLEAASR